MGGEELAAELPTCNEEVLDEAVRCHGAGGCGLVMSWLVKDGKVRKVGK